MADWTHRGEYIIAKHDVTPEQADEALDDPNAVTFAPDYNSKSGDSIRTIGYSISAQHVLSVITVEEDDIVYGANAWRSNRRDRQHYQQGGP
ncbi:BrnT family toxin [Mycobacterium sp. 852014-50255_SCH5639931]|uniref:BrnT family toxin n=1 Tax=Mycobacterium sp. 852014-50255_SCH5639931 TaxID=1834112 RepID=UPI0007FB8B0E|nr:BrnT family toxin [Mycobacterium sp. 852014-50255_SCH5639931]OBB63923.1 transposase [Mycobacterium sp. 852014-50255_SCH5639931]